MASLGDVPPEVVEQIVILADPLDLPALARSARLYNDIINPPNYQRLWQTLYLFQPLDDPRTCRDQYGRPTFLAHKCFDWRTALQRIMRARKVVLNPTFCKPEERCDVLLTLLYLITNIPPARSSLVWSGRVESHNLTWVASLLQKSTYLDTTFALSAEEDQLRAKILSHFGLTRSDMRRAALTRSRAYVYDMRNYRPDNLYGPFMMINPVNDDILRPTRHVNWLHVQAIHRVMSIPMVQDRLLEPPIARAQNTLEEHQNLLRDILFIVEEEEGWEGENFLDDCVFIRYPMSLPYCQSVIPDGINLDIEVDWAGVEGLWGYVFCYTDHNSLLRFNRFCVSETNPRDTTALENDRFREIFHTLTVDLRITRTQPDPHHPTRPRLHFAGDDLTGRSFVGWVGYTSDEHIRWHFEYGYNNHMTWSSSGVQVGAVRSSFGVLGGWTTVNHGPLAPVGPFWLHKLSEVIKDDS